MASAEDGPEENAAIGLRRHPVRVVPYPRLERHAQIHLVARLDHCTERQRGVAPACVGPRPRNGYHPTQKPLRLLRRTVFACTMEGELIFDPFCGSGTTEVTAKELDRFFVGAEREGEAAKLAGRRIGAAKWIEPPVQITSLYGN